MLDFPRIARRIGVVTLLAAVLAGVALPSPAMAVPTDTNGIGGAPASDSKQDGRSRFSYELAPGQTVQDQYLVDQQVTVFATDAYNTAAGEFALLDTAQKPKDAGSWVTFANGETKVAMSLHPDESRILDFTVTIPADARPGDHAGGIVISAPAAQGQVLVDRRVAPRLYVRGAGNLQPALTITSISSSYGYTWNPITGSTTITATVTNSGNIALSGNVAAGVNTYFGIPAAASVGGQLAEMLPGSTRTLSYRVPGIAQVGYLDTYVTLQPIAASDSSSPGALRIVTRNAAAFAMPWWLVAILVLGALLWLVFWIRRRVDARRAAAWVAYTEAEARRKAAEGESEGDESDGHAVRERHPDPEPVGTP